MGAMAVFRFSKSWISMGSDDLFKKRKARSEKDYARQKKSRVPYKRFLIVCEGTKTEPYYLQELLSDLNIRHHKVEIARNNDSSPDKVVGRAIELFDEDALSGDAFDQVFCVFDRDTHEHFHTAVREINDLNNSKKTLTYHAITSEPCFEYWLLLHFGYTDRPFHAAGKKSVGDQVVCQLKTKPGFKQYGKGQKETYQLLKANLEKAMIYAERGRDNAVRTGQTNPITHVDVLVAALKSLAQTDNLVT